uniref:Uncharacterized protein n=1 Tax=viral metagenome TaxID=1070528 RepID=A0A6M3LQU7_9ZZZZ
MTKRTALIVIAGIASACVVLADNELNLSQGWQYNKNGRQRIKSTVSTRYNVNGNGVIENVQLITTNEVGDLLDLGGVTDPGFAAFKNLGVNFTMSTNGVYTNLIEIGSWDANSNFVVFLSIETNRSCQTWIGTAAPRARTIGTNSVQLDYVIMDK